MLSRSFGKYKAMKPITACIGDNQIPVAILFKLLPGHQAKYCEETAAQYREKSTAIPFMLAAVTFAVSVLDVNNHSPATPDLPNPRALLGIINGWSRLGIVGKHVVIRLCAVIAEHTNSQIVIEKLSCSPHIAVKVTVADNPHVSINTLKRMIDQNGSTNIYAYATNFYIANKILSHPDIDLSTLRELAGMPNAKIRAKVAMNPLCPVDIMDDLAGDAEILVLECLLLNPNCPSELKMLLRMTV